MTHGTITGYSYHKCRCDLCAAVWREYQRNYYTEHREQGTAKSRRYYYKHLDTIAARRELDKDEQRKREADWVRRQIQDDPGYYRRKHLWTEYGMTPDDWSLLFAGQGGACAICRTKEPGGRYGSWHVDHDHGSGLVRGILCHACNMGIGQFKDCADHLAAAADYLRATDGSNRLPNEVQP